MAGGTKCYEVRNVGGNLIREMVEHSPKFADNIATAVAKLRRGEHAYVRFYELAKVEQQFTSNEGQP